MLLAPGLVEAHVIVLMLSLVMIQRISFSQLPLGSIESAPLLENSLVDALGAGQASVEGKFCSTVVIGLTVHSMFSLFVPRLHCS